MTKKDAQDMTHDNLFTHGPTEFDDSGNPRLKRKSNLQPLTPLTTLGRDDPAVSALFDAYEDSRIRNIAITGPYGAGKSSVIASFVKLKDEPSKFISVSISTIATGGGKEEPTNFNLEREISKQILNFNPSGKIGQPMNSLRNFSRFELFKQISVLAFGALMAVFLLVLVGAGPFSTWSASGTEYAFLGLGVILLTFIIGQFLGTKNLAAKVSAGFAEIDIAKRNESSFDEFSADLVRFFQNRPGTTIILEDIDRFDEPTIFDRLHDLNGLLNAATGVDRKNEPIRFIYALKESIFESSKVPQVDADAEKRDASLEELERTREAFSESSRRKTKFFDLVIPVLPIVNQANSYYQLCHQLQERGFNPNYELIAHISDYVLDQRLITSIVNEFEILQDSFTFGGSTHSGMPQKADRVLALVAYKNLFPRDFEKGQYGESTLDRILYGFNETKRDLVLPKLREIEESTNRVKIREKVFAEKIVKPLESGKFFWLDDSGLERIQGEKINALEIQRLLFDGKEVKLDFSSEDGIVRPAGTIPSSFNLDSPITVVLSNDQKFDVWLFWGVENNITWSEFVKDSMDNLIYELMNDHISSMSELLSMDVMTLQQVVPKMARPGIITSRTTGIPRTLIQELSEKFDRIRASQDPQTMEFLDELLEKGFLMSPISEVTRSKVTIADLEAEKSRVGPGFKRLKRILQNDERVSAELWEDKDFMYSLFFFRPTGTALDLSKTSRIKDAPYLVLLQGMAAIELCKNPNLLESALERTLIQRKTSGPEGSTFTHRFGIVGLNIIRACSEIGQTVGLVNSKFPKREYSPVFDIAWGLLPEEDKTDILRAVLSPVARVRLVPSVKYYIPPRMREMLLAEKRRILNEKDKRKGEISARKTMMLSVIEQLESNFEFSEELEDGYSRNDQISLESI